MMIKLVFESRHNKTYGIFCDSDTCGHVLIAKCDFFRFEEGQELQYSAILCETCGRRRNDDDGKDKKKIADLEKLIEKLEKEKESLIGDLASANE